jgi:hypothetical protein
MRHFSRQNCKIFRQSESGAAHGEEGWTKWSCVVEAIELNVIRLLVCSALKSESRAVDKGYELS